MPIPLPENPNPCRFCGKPSPGRSLDCSEAHKKAYYRSQMTDEEREARREKDNAKKRKPTGKCECGAIISPRAAGGSGLCRRCRKNKYEREHPREPRQRTARSQQRREQAERKAQREAAGNNAKPLPRYGGTNKAGPQMGSERVVPGVIRVVRAAYATADEFEQAALRQRNPDIDFESETK